MNIHMKLQTRIGDVSCNVESLAEADEVIAWTQTLTLPPPAAPEEPQPTSPEGK